MNGASQGMMQLFEGARNLRELRKTLKTEGVTVHLSELVGGAFSFYAAAAVAREGGVHVFVAEDRDAAAYLLNDFYALLDEQRVLFYPSAYKKSILYGTEDAQGVLQRTAALNAVRNAAGGYHVVCTYPEALAEKVVDADAMRRDTIAVKVGDRIKIADFEELLTGAGFVQVDFVYEPGQYSVRGGIVDVFSYSESRPYRLDFFDDDVDSIRRFEISSQLSSDRLERVEIVPNLKGGAGMLVSLAEFAGRDAVWWMYDCDYVMRRVDDLRRKMLQEAEEPAEVDNVVTSRRALLADMERSRMVFCATTSGSVRPLRR